MGLPSAATVVSGTTDLAGAPLNAAAWKRLVDKIHESNVVPIIGPRLLVGPDGKSLQEPIARRLLADCSQPADVPLPAFRELNEAVSLLRVCCDPQDLYDQVNEAIRSVLRPPPPAPPIPVPTPIRQLAQITGFRLYVTLTPDDLLAECLKQRCAVNEIVHSPNLPTSEGKDLPVDWQSRPGEVQLLYLFGKSRSAPMFAIHDEDVLEYAHNVIAHGSQVPNGFMGELQQRNLLLVGCNFPDWLTRFFLRATNQKRLSEKDRRAWLIEPLKPEESLTCFLRSYSRETEVLSQESPEQFVAELYQHWMETYGAETPESAQSQQDDPPHGAMFFVSYSRRTDAPQAQSIYDSLLKLGLNAGEVWFDRTIIEPGADFQRKIVDGIRGCRYFLPLISQAANGREEGFVFTEWREAYDRGRGMNREFVLPVIVDADYAPEKYAAQTVWEWRRDNIDFGHAPGGVPDGRLQSTLQKLVRDARRGGE
jgi:hypothetical protein